MTCGITSAGSAPLVERPADEVEISLRRAGKAELDLLEADPHQELQQCSLALVTHWIGQRLVAVAQVDGAPSRGESQRAIGPAPVGQVHTRRGLVTSWIEGHRDLGR